MSPESRRIRHRSKVDDEGRTNDGAGGQALYARREWLTGKNFAALKYSGPGTDLTLGLAEGHAWRGGGAARAENLRRAPAL